jgi:hypothetical protein
MWYMYRSVVITLCVFLLCPFGVIAGEHLAVSLQDLSQVELKSAGIEVMQPVTLHVKALGAANEQTRKSEGTRMFAYAWILDADTRQPVWRMDVDNTEATGDDRRFDGSVRLERGNYEIYFAVCTFTFNSLFTHVTTNVDHRDTPLFVPDYEESKGFFSFFKEWFSEDIGKAWNKRAAKWGVNIFVDESASYSLRPFTPPKRLPDVLFRATGLGDSAVVRQGFSTLEPLTVKIYALGEGKDEDNLVDYGWIVDTKDRSRVWEMSWRNSMDAGGAKKNLEWKADIALKKGDYVLYFITDDSHSMADWNAAPPYDPYNWGITLQVKGEKEKSLFKLTPYQEYQNVIVSITNLGSSETRTEGFTLTQDARLRILAFGEQEGFSRSMTDYAYIIDGNTRSKVWTMDVDRTYHAGGALKNRYVDEIISLPRGSYLVTYVTDDSHGYDDWNDAPPFDPDHYGVTIMGAGEQFDGSVVKKYVEKHDQNIIAQIVRVGDDVDRQERFRLDKVTRVRIYAIGEGYGREMIDYGWIEDAGTGNIVWEMKYPMTFHAGGARKNRVINTTIMLDKGEYILHYKTDDSHAYGDWNVEPPDDQQYYGITLSRDQGQIIPPALPAPPPVPTSPRTPSEPGVR